jgi:hypothetical protein
MDIEFNNAASLDTNGTGWFVGFSDWAKAKLAGVRDLRYMPQCQRSHSLCMKWMQHPTHDPRGAVKLASAGRTLSILISEAGCFRLEFSQYPGFPANQITRHTLNKQGDFVIWGAGLYHRWSVDKACTILTLRWIPDDNVRA